MSEYAIEFADWCEFPPETMVGETVYDSEGNAIGWITNATLGAGTCHMRLACEEEDADGCIWPDHYECDACGAKVNGHYAVLRHGDTAEILPELQKANSQGGLTMNATIEQLETLRTPFATITPTIWHDGDMCGLASLRVVLTCPLASWVSDVVARAIGAAL